MSSSRQTIRFHDRRDAGRRLAVVLADARLDDPIVLALPRGGVPVGYEIAKALGAPLDVFVARKVGAPGHPEYGIGAVAEGTDRLVLSEQAASFSLSRDQLAEMAEKERIETRRRVGRYRADRPLPATTDRVVVLVDDGLATGVTAEAALRALADQRPSQLILAVPVSAGRSADRLKEFAEVVCLLRPAEFRAVGVWYDDFTQTTDAEVLDLLDSARGS